MTDRPIIFSGPMVRALLAGRKTQTRRLASSPLAKCQPGDRLWVRESVWVKGRWANLQDETGERKCRWIGTKDTRRMADDPTPIEEKGFVWRSVPSIHMPRWANRLTLVVTDVRRQRLQDITTDDARAEGVQKCHLIWSADGETFGGTPRDAFSALWTSLHGVQSWADNPHIVALTFTVHHANIDRYED